MKKGLPSVAARMFAATSTIGQPGPTSASTSERVSCSSNPTSGNRRVRAAGARRAIEPRTLGVEVLVANGRDHQQVVELGETQEVAQRTQRRRSGPVQVLDE